MTSPAIAQTLPEAQSSGLLLARRLWAIFIRHVYLHLGSWPRIAEMMYWPLINMLSWGFSSLYIVKKLTGVTVIAGTFVGGVLLNEVFMRMTMTTLVLFLEEVWSRNLGHLFASPLKLSNYAFGILLTGLVRMTISVIPAMIVAYYLFGFSILSFGWPLAAFVVLLVLNGCWFGLLIISMLFRYGLAAEWLAWMCTWLLIPFVAPYYPVAILPDAMQAISWAIPATYVFECMKGLLAGKPLNAAYLWDALALNLMYIVLSALIFYRAYQSTQKRGGILQVGE